MKNKRIMLILGTLALIRPLMKMTGWIHLFGNEAVGSIALTLLLSLVWFVVIVGKKVDDPLQTAIGAGVCYAALAIVLSAVLSPLLTGKLQGPLTNPYALVSVFVTNIIWGLIVGLISKVVLTYRKR